MPFLDLSELMGDPDFGQAFQVVRHRVTADAHGLGVDDTETFDAYGSIQQGSGWALQRLPEGALLGDTIEIFTQFILQDGDASGELIADTVVYKNAPYTVMNVYDWSEWGAGWVHAIAVLAVQNRGDA